MTRDVLWILGVDDHTSSSIVNAFFSRAVSINGDIVGASCLRDSFICCFLVGMMILCTLVDGLEEFDVAKVLLRRRVRWEAFVRGCVKNGSMLAP